MPPVSFRVHSDPHQRTALTPTDPHLRVVILAGGAGSRFWPASTPARPKQLLPLVSRRPLVADAVSRALKLAPANHVRIVAGRHLRARLTAALPELPADSFLWEPRPRGTAPALTWATWRAWRRDPDAVIVSLHSDHVVRPESAFRSLVARAVRIAHRRDLLLTVGARPDRPETGYGYLQPGDALEASAGGRADELPRRVLRFHEKPDARRADEYVRQGFRWNTGIFAWRASVFLEELRAHAPDIAALVPRLETGDVEGFFRRAPAESVDEAVLERSRICAMLAASFEWDDVGSWEALARTRGSDANGNTRAGEAILVDSEDNIVYSESGRVVLFGVREMVVVAAGDVTMVTTRDRARELKRLVERLPASPPAQAT